MTQGQMGWLTGAIAHAIGLVMLLAAIAAPPPAAAQTPMSPGRTPAVAPAPGTPLTRAAASPVTNAPVSSPQGADVDLSITGLGICQCISDHAIRRLTCSGSAMECQSGCASTRYSWVPHAITCPLAQAQPPSGG